MPCNERARQGRIGAGKALGFISGVFWLHHMIGEVWKSSDPLRTGFDSIQIRRTRDRVARYSVFGYCFDLFGLCCLHVCL